jgi:glycosyltransferase involved in cell wall biosynthesis
MAAVEALRMHPLVLLFGVPFNHELVGRFGEVLSVFDDTGANWLTFCEPADKPRVQLAYQRVREKADVILVATDFMRRLLNRPQGAVELIPQGVDYSTFEQSFSAAPPDDLQRLPHPWLGYVGALGERLDLNILEAVADAFPTGSLVLVGPMGAPESYFAKLRNKSNVHFFGRRDYREVPLYVNAFEVFVIPHKVTDETLSQRSMKFYERLATGKPTVSTPVPPAPEFAKLSYIAANPESFVAATKQALEEDGSSISFRRREAAAKESWDNRAERILEIITSRLERPVAKDADDIR